MAWAKITLQPWKNRVCKRLRVRGLVLTRSGRLLGLSWRFFGRTNAAKGGDTSRGKAFFVVLSYSWLQFDFPPIWEGLGRIWGRGSGYFGMFGNHFLQHVACVFAWFDAWILGMDGTDVFRCSRFRSCVAVFAWLLKGCRARHLFSFFFRKG